MNAHPPYWFLTLFLLAAVAFPLVPIFLARAWAWKFTPAKPGAEKNAAYECGIAATDDARVRFHSQYYLYGILFLIFDVEALFLFPVAVAFLGLSPGAVFAILIFVLLLLEGLAWAWMKGVLTWR